MQTKKNQKLRQKKFWGCMTSIEKRFFLPFRRLSFRSTLQVPCTRSVSKMGWLRWRPSRSGKSLRTEKMIFFFLIITQLDVKWNPHGVLKNLLTSFDIRFRRLLFIAPKSTGPRPPKLDPENREKTRWKPCLKKNQQRMNFYKKNKFFKSLFWLEISRSLGF